MPGSEPPFYTDPLPTACWSLKTGLVLWSRLLFLQMCNYIPQGDGHQGCTVGSNGRNYSGENVSVCEGINDSLCFIKSIENCPFIGSGSMIRGKNKTKQKNILPMHTTHYTFGCQDFC